MTGKLKPNIHGARHYLSLLTSYLSRRLTGARPRAMASRRLSANPRGRLGIHNTHCIFISPDKEMLPNRDRNSLRRCWVPWRRRIRAHITIIQLGPVLPCRHDRVLVYPGLIGSGQTREFTYGCGWSWFMKTHEAEEPSGSQPAPYLTRVCPTRRKASNV
ncbi:hypothetical protein FA13DRAFT_221913 [Coprinellus micaceus]|uniref:Uncharacterized protein n=1 Tax=Coprinellus micaceus TaxID=71717 RepID=A0A4Y7TGR9_COPMI|nr:hypothetical protein FA13DRAFT_221913 [Coprinellus micaceus]